MAIIEVVKFDGPPDLLVWKYPNQELGTWTQLIVNETQEALLFKGGEALDLLGPGRHTLSTQNIPVLSSVVNLPFGGKSPFTAEIWFVNKLHKLDLKWGTPTPIQLQEPKYHMMVSVRAFGQLGIQIEDTRKFLLKLVGTLPAVDQAALGKYFRSILMMNIKELISAYLVHKKISILEINAYISEISKHMESRIVSIFQEYGIRLVGFQIDSINLPEEDPATKRLKEALAKKAEMDILGFSYQQERTFNTLESAAKNEGNPSAFLGAGIGLGLGQGVGMTIGDSFSRLSGHMDVSAPVQTCSNCGTSNAHDSSFCRGCGQSLKQGAASSAVACQACGHSLPAGSKFCPNCGDKYRPCPRCQADNPEQALHCAKCGESLGAPCPQCATMVEAGSKFCPECGKSMVLTCSQCQQVVQPGQKFCFECGNKLG
ncbi:SPFH domain-containing protein [Paenibacillus oleatilyticus]|uniref:SPFH domain-containing protein n=1 Tax=Paenibacillus oleatilyticus TaxID=2594886 RepID=UPI001C201394|nr:SPFH domain-containing protein [Paenibacillus oleatilyticus]MBU7317742.1 SPFH domain-containing protein [Paenibacillus oleatilyticus]